MEISFRADRFPENKSGQAISRLSRLATIVILFMLLNTGCKKLVAVDSPVTSVNEANVYASDATATAVLTGIYSSMSGVGFSGNFTGNSSISLLSGLSADELTLWSGVGGATATKYIYYYRNALSANPSASSGSDHWSPLYNYVFKCNAAIEGLAGSKVLTPSVKQQLLGEAKFMRAFFYFYLVNLFGDVPLALTTDPQANTILVRTPKVQVYQQIIADLKDAQGLLNTDYLDGNLHPYTGTKERVRPTKWAATALLARLYLYSGDYINAEAQATLVINNLTLYSLNALNDVFKKNSAEAIWQLQPVITGHNTEDGWTFIIPANGPSNVNGSNGNPVYLSTNLLNNFEAGDQRMTNGNWINSITVSGTTYYYPYKYKVQVGSTVTEYLMVLRLGELYLIRAEARAQQNNISGTKSDLNEIRTRAGLPNTTANDKNSLLTAILHERQVELFTEWGNRWFDLKRTNNIDAIMNIITPQKGGGTWQSFQQLYPILFSDIQKNPNLVQNSGY